MTPTRRTRNVVAAAIDTPRLTLEDMAEALEVSKSAVEKFRLAPARGRPLYEMPARLRLRLAAYLETHARRLLALSEELRETAAGEE